MQTLGIPAIARDALTVTELVAALRSTVARNPALTDVLVRGEVGSVSRPPSGVAYFVLKDAQAGRHFFSSNLNEHNQAKYLYLKKP